MRSCGCRMFLHTPFIVQETQSRGPRKLVPLQNTSLHKFLSTKVSSPSLDPSFGHKSTTKKVPHFPAERLHHTWHVHKLYPGVFGHLTDLVCLKSGTVECPSAFPHWRTRPQISDTIFGAYEKKFDQGLVLSGGGRKYSENKMMQFSSCRYNNESQLQHFG